MATASATAPERPIPDSAAKTAGARSSGKKVVFKDGNVVIKGKEGFVYDLGTKENRPRDEWIPRRSEYKVFVMPDEYECRRGIATGQINLSDLDPGWYRIKVKKIPKPNMQTRGAKSDVNWGYEFLVGVTEEEFRRLQGVKLRYARAIMTTESTPEYRCTIENCDEVSMTYIAAILHQWREHFNIDPLKASPEEMDSKILPTRLGQAS